MTMRANGLGFALAFVALTMAGASVAGDRDETVEIKGWGRVVDPDGDCLFSIRKQGVAIAVPGSVHALTAELDWVNAPRVVQPVTGDFVVQVEVSGVVAPETPSQVSGRRPFRGAGLIVWKDAQTYVRLERAGMTLDGKGVTYANFESRRDGRFERIGDAFDRPVHGSTTHLRLERRGATLIGSVSTNGILWTPLKPIALDLPATVGVGIAATHNTSSPFEPQFEHFRLDREARKVD